MKFLPSLIKQISGCAQDPATDVLTAAQFNWLVKELESDDTKRLIFDARQAKVFDFSDEIDEQRKTKIHPPFRRMYMELTEPILLKAQEPGCQDVLYGILYHENALGSAREVLDQGKVRREVAITKVTFFYHDATRVQWVDRTWSMAPEGYPLVGRAPKNIKRRYKNEQGESATASGLIQEDLLPEYVQEGEMVSIFELKQYGWWEQTIIANTNLLYWLFAYTMAKSVEVVEIPVSRQVRRALQREGRVPNPWHIVRVNPKRVKNDTEYVGEGGKKHSYRYDVIGHLRFNRHMTKEGWKETIEWVSDHQRGLENELYIPKTYKVEKDKQIAIPEMERYFEEGEK